MFRYNLYLLVVFSLLGIGCGGGQTAAEQPPPAPTPQADESYTLRLVFDGLVTFVTPDRTTSPSGPAWVLLGNAADPSRFPVGKKIPPHSSHLLIPESAQVSGRGLQRQPPHSTAPHLDHISGDWRMITLKDEDLSLDVSSLDPLQVVRGTKRLPYPCTPGRDAQCTTGTEQLQIQDFEWTVDLDAALALVPRVRGEDRNARRLRDCLTAEPHSCRTDTPLLAARLKIDRGRIFTKSLLKDGGGYALHNLGSSFQVTPKGIAQEVAAEITVTGPVRFRSKSLADGTSKGDIVVTPQPGQKVLEIRLANHPDCDPVQCVQQGFIDNDFLFNFNLLNDPTFAPQDQLPGPEAVQNPGPMFNGQCSPSSSSGSGGG